MRPWQHDCVIGKFAEVGNFYEVMVTQLTANEALEFELESAPIAGSRGRTRLDLKENGRVARKTRGENVAR